MVKIHGHWVYERYNLIPLNILRHVGAYLLRSQLYLWQWRLWLGSNPASCVYLLVGHRERHQPPYLCFSIRKLEIITVFISHCEFNEAKTFIMLSAWCQIYSNCLWIWVLGFWLETCLKASIVRCFITWLDCKRKYLNGSETTRSKLKRSLHCNWTIWDRLYSFPQYLVFQFILVPHFICHSWRYFWNASTYPGPSPSKKQKLNCFSLLSPGSVEYKSSHAASGLWSTCSPKAPSVVDQVSLWSLSQLKDETPQTPLLGSHSQVISILEW